MLDIGPFELIVILVIAALVFGPGKLADLGSGLGKGIREFKQAIAEEKPAVTETTAPAASASTATEQVSEAEERRAA